MFATTKTAPEGPRPAEPHSGVPRNRDDCHDSGDGATQALIEIEERIERIERELAPMLPLAMERERLLRARAALLGEAAPAPDAPRSLVSREQVRAHLTRNPGSKPGEIAYALGTTPAAVSSHLYRGKSRLFATEAGRWYALPA